MCCNSSVMVCLKYRSQENSKLWNAVLFIRITVDVVVEIGLFGVAIRAEDVENTGLLLGREGELAVHVAIVGRTTAEVLLEFSAYRGVVPMLYVEEQLAEPPRCAYHSLFDVELALAILQRIGVDGKASVLSSGRCRPAK